MRSIFSLMLLVGKLSARVPIPLAFLILFVFLLVFLKIFHIIMGIFHFMSSLQAWDDITIAYTV